MIGSKDRILDAAERIVLRDGVGHLTLDAVAAETQISKGGLLYHFHSKDDLIVGMIQRLLDLYEQHVAELIASDPEPRGRLLRAMLRAGFPEEPCETTKRIDRMSAALLAAAVTNPCLCEPVRERSRIQHQALLAEVQDPVLATIIHTAGDGLWLGGMFGIAMPDAGMQGRVVARLIEMSKTV